MRTTTSNTEMMVIENAGTGPALKVTQTGVNSIAEFYDDGGVLALKIADGGNVGIGTSAPLQKLHVQGGCILENAGTGPALKVTQTGVNSIAEFYDDGNVLALKIADGGNVGIGTSMPITKLDVVGILKATGLQINDITNAFMPRGGIIMWSGSIATIPTGWAICDGTNGTPNLYNRFVIGAGSTYNVAATGGSTTKSLQIDNLPSHNHTGTTALAGNHAHTVTVGYYNEGTQLNGFGIEDASSSFIGPVSAGTDTQGNHTHTFTTNNTGSGTAFDITPPYYALAYIMKL
jgi:microcystin-dependent protein